MAQVKIWHLDWESEEYARLAGESLSDAFLKLGAYAEIGWRGEFDRGLHDVTVGDSGAQRNALVFLNSVMNYINLKRKEDDYGEELLAREASNAVIWAFRDIFGKRGLLNTEIVKLFLAVVSRYLEW